MKGKTTIIVLALHFATVEAKPMSLWDALAEIESGRNDKAVGKCGEVSRWQILPAVWEQYRKPGMKPCNAKDAMVVAWNHYGDLGDGFILKTSRKPTETDMLILWRLGVKGYSRLNFNPARVSKLDKKRIRDFRRLRDGK